MLIRQKHQRNYFISFSNVLYNIIYYQDLVHAFIMALQYQITVYFMVFAITGNF